MLQKLYYNDIRKIKKGSLQKILIVKFRLFLFYIKYLYTMYPNYIIHSVIDYLELEIRVYSWAVSHFILNLFYTTWGLFNNFSDLVCIDYLGRYKRFELIYLLLSIKYNSRIRIKIFVNELLPLQSLVFFLPAIGWFEREVWDLFGIFFKGNLDLRRLLNDYGFLGHPLRKDFPLSGFFELFYDDSIKRIIYEKVSLAQAYRIFKFNNPWIS